jgi:DNA-binding CsgD family transcriptional regulator
MELQALSSGDYLNIERFLSEVGSFGDFFREGVLSSLHKIFGYQHSIFWKLDDNNHLNEPVSLNIEEQILDLYIRNFRGEDLLSPQKISPLLPLCNVIRIGDVTTKRSYEQSHYYQSFMNNYGYYHELGVYLLDGVRIIGVIGLVRTKSEQSFNSKDVHQLKLLSQFLSPRFQLERLKDQQQLFESLANMGVILFDPAFNIHHANPLAKQLAVEYLNFRKSSNVFDNPIKNFMIQVVHNTPWKLGLKKNIFFSANQRHTLEVFPLQNQKVYAACIKQNEPVFDAPEVYETALTTKEKDVVKLAAQGYTNPEIATLMFVSVNTVKKHLQNIYQKLGVNNRTSLSYITRND